MSAVEVFWKYCGKRRNCLSQAISPFHTLFSTHIDFRQILNCRLQTLSIWSSLKFAVWERVKVFNFLPNKKIFALSKLKAFEDDKLKLAEWWNSSLLE